MLQHRKAVAGIGAVVSLPGVLVALVVMATRIFTTPVMVGIFGPVAGLQYFTPALLYGLYLGGVFSGFSALINDCSRRAAGWYVTIAASGEIAALCLEYRFQGSDSFIPHGYFIGSATLWAIAATERWRTTRANPPAASA